MEEDRVALPGAWLDGQQSATVAFVERIEDF